MKRSLPTVTLVALVGKSDDVEAVAARPHDAIHTSGTSDDKEKVPARTNNAIDTSIGNSDSADNIIIVREILTDPVNECVLPSIATPRAAYAFFRAIVRVIIASDVAMSLIQQMLLPRASPPMHRELKNLAGGRPKYQ